MLPVGDQASRWGGWGGAQAEAPAERALEWGGVGSHLEQGREEVSTPGTQLAGHTVVWGLGTAAHEKAGSCHFLICPLMELGRLGQT